MTLYRNIIKSSWRMTLRHKYLWFFGLFAVLLGNGGEYELFFKSITSEERTESIWSGFISQIGLNFDNLVNIGKRFWENPSLTFVILITYTFILAVFLFIFWMMSVSQIAIVNATARQARDKDHGMKIGLQKGIRHFWPVFSLNLIIKLLIIVSLALLAMAQSTLLYVFLFLIIIPLSISILFVIKYSIAYIIVRKEKMIDALVSGWALFRRNWIISLELAALLYLFTIVAGLFFMFLGFNIEKFFEVLVSVYPKMSFYIFVVVMPMTLFMALAFIGSLLAVFQTTAWTKLFLELDSKGAKSKIERVFSK